MLPVGVRSVSSRVCAYSKYSTVIIMVRWDGGDIDHENKKWLQKNKDENSKEYQRTSNQNCADPSFCYVKNEHF